MIFMNEYSPEPDADQVPQPETNEFADLHELIEEFEASQSGAATGPVFDSHAPTHGQLVPNDVGDPQLTHVPRWKLLHLLLFLATFLSTFFVGMSTGEIPMPPPGTEGITGEMWSVMISNGLIYSCAVMAILFAHEMGHYLQARRYRVAASPPYFIPMPISPFGTMGAVIVQYSGYADRKKLYDIAISGPLAGLVLALPIAWWGIQQSVVKSIPPNATGVTIFGDPLVMQWMYELVHGPLGKNETVMLNPLLFAGWVGIFITALNLIPVGQLDGGHIVYSLIGKRAHTVAMLVLGGGMAYMVYTGSYQYTLIIVLLLFMGPRHPPTANDHEKLGWFRIVLGWLTLAFIFIGFTPNPISMQ